MSRLFSFPPAPRLAQGLFFGALCALLIGGASLTGLLSGLERGTFDALLRARGERNASPQIVILVADDETISTQGRWPLPRRVYTEVIRRLTRAGAKTIAF